jgi:hypothetical protein
VGCSGVLKKRNRFYFFLQQKTQCFFGFLYFTLKLTLKNGYAFWTFLEKKNSLLPKKFPNAKRQNSYFKMQGKNEKRKLDFHATTKVAFSFLQRKFGHFT